MSPKHRRPDRDDGPDRTRLRPRVNRSDPPVWYELSDDGFEDLCRDLHSRQRGINNASRYGERGQRQMGVDIIAYRQDGKREAGQCKRYRDFKKWNLDDLVEKFRDDLDHWRERGVVLFRIYVASEVRSRQVLDALHGHQDDFRELGMTLELWDGREIDRRLDEHPEIRRRYDDSSLMSNMQNVAPVSASPNAGHLLRWVQAQAEVGGLVAGELADSLSRLFSERLDEIRERYRSGRRRAAKDEVQGILDDSAWPRLAAGVKSRALRLMALYTMTLDGDLRAAREIAARADSNVRDSLSRSLEAVLRWVENQEVPDQTPDGAPEIAQLRASALLESGRPKEAVEALDAASGTGGQEAESWRLRALAQLNLGWLSAARESADRALDTSPNWLSVREVDAIVKFWEGAGTATSELPLDRYLPEPFPRELVRGDDAAIRLIEDAARQFAELVDQADHAEERRKLRVWQFICLANLPTGEPALELCLSLLEEDPGSPMLLRWGFARGLPIDKNRALDALAAAMPEQADYLDRIGVRATLLLDRGEAAAALELLEENAAAFLKSGHASALAQWRVHALAALGRHHEAFEALEMETDEGFRDWLRIHIERARAAGTQDPTPVIEALRSSYQRSGRIDLLLHIAVMQMGSGDFDSVQHYADDLVRRAPTPSVIRLLASAYWEGRRARKCLELLDEQKQVFPGQQLPEDLRHLRQYCLGKLGYRSEAIEDARQIAELENTSTAWLNLLDAQGYYGDVVGLENTGRRILAAEDVGQAGLIRAAGPVSIASPDLARQLWNRAIDQGRLEDDLVAPAFDLGHRLGVPEPELAPLMRRMWELGRSDLPFVQLLTLEQVVDTTLAWREQEEEIRAGHAGGEFSIYIIPDEFRRTIIETFSMAHTPRRCSPDPSSEPPLFARHGGRPLGASTPLTGPLLLDPTSVVLASSLGVLDQLIETYESVLIPRGTLALLLSEIGRLRHHQPLRSDATKGCRAANSLGRDLHPARAGPLEQIQSGLCPNGHAVGGSHRADPWSRRAGCGVSPPYRARRQR